MRDVIITLVYEAENLVLAKLSVSLVSSHSVFLDDTLEATLRCPECGHERAKTSHAGRKIGLVPEFYFTETQCSSSRHDPRFHELHLPLTVVGIVPTRHPIKVF